MSLQGTHKTMGRQHPTREVSCSRHVVRRKLYLRCKVECFRPPVICDPSEDLAAGPMNSGCQLMLSGAQLLCSEPRKTKNSIPV